MLHITQASPLVEVKYPEAQVAQNPLRVQLWQLEIKQKALQTLLANW